MILFSNLIVFFLKGDSDNLRYMTILLYNLWDYGEEFGKNNVLAELFPEVRSTIYEKREF